VTLPDRRFWIAAAILFTTAFVAVVPVLARQAPPAIPSAEDFGRESSIRNVSISPDGRHIAAITSPDGVATYVSIWRTDAPGETPRVLGLSGRNSIQGVQFIKNERLAVRVRQTYTSGVTKMHLIRLFIVDLDGKKWMTALGGDNPGEFVSAQVIDNLPTDPNNILVASRDGIYKLDVFTGRSGRVFVSSDKFGGEQIDLTGEVRARQSVDYENGKVYIAQWIRNPKTNAWEEHFRWFAADREPREIIGFTRDPNVVYVSSSAGRDKAAIYEYDITTRQTGEPIFETKLFDATGVIQSDSPADYGRLLGFSYAAENGREYWVDGKIDALSKGLRKAFGIKTVPVAWTDIASGEKVRYSTADGADVLMTSWSDDLSRAIVVKVGASQPPEYYLLADGKVTLLGKARPWMNTAALGDTRLVQYAARDGLLIPAFLTTPKKEIYGAGPYPTIILPHGGPWGRDDLGWDGSGWVQYFAARGYVVLQPQFRGSQGWGQKLWRAGDAEWGQKMQDDKDDGAKWLVAQGIAAPDRIAMHGYSYGGYSAMAAAVRPNGIYQCSVAGAGVASIEKFREIVNQSRILRELQRPTINGLSPFEKASEVSIPIFLYHGDRDTTVPISESERFVSVLKSSGKPYRYLEIKDMGHQSVLWEAGQVAEVLTAVESFLTTECGPGGL